MIMEYLPFVSMDISVRSGSLQPPERMRMERGQPPQAGGGASRAERTAFASMSARYGFGRNVVPGTGSGGEVPLERMTLMPGSIFRISRRTSIPDR